MPNLVSPNRYPDRYNDANTFEPTRFFDDNIDAYTSALSAHYMQRDHFHYGIGRRLCQGIHLAEDSLFIEASRILWAFDIKQLPGYPLRMADKICELFKSIVVKTPLSPFSFSPLWANVHRRLPAWNAAQGISLHNQNHSKHLSPIGTARWWQS
jgi:cytochrome P450